MFKHNIKINNIKSININAYFLSQLQLNKQTKQITELLNKNLIYKFVRYITHDSCAISVVPPFNRL